MRKSDIVRLVFIGILTIAAIICCVAALSIRFDLEETGETVEGAEAVGFAFAAAFGFLIVVLFAFGGMIAAAVSVLLCAFGLRSPVGWMKITFLVLMIVDIALILTTAIGTFAGL